MRARSRIVIVWTVATLLLAGSAVGFATTGSNHGSEASSAAHARNETRAAEREEPETPATSDAKGSERERKANHGFYVSQAAHCEDVPGFTAPADCKDGGKAHGEYVSSVARSSLGKSSKAKGPKK
jgi:hypothetical protein